MHENQLPKNADDEPNPLSYRQTWVEVSLDAIMHNMRWFKHNTANSCKVMAVVKADGYGHGAIEVAQAAIAAGADYLGVAFLDEAIQLRAAGIKDPILLLGYTPPHAIQAAIKAEATITVFSEYQVADIIYWSEQLGQSTKVHLKIDTGMTRLGVTSAEEAMLISRKIVSSPFVHLEGIFTHFANADSEDSTYTNEQYHTFITLLNELDKQQIDIPLKHCCNSAAAIQYPHFHMDMVRIGISLYGLSPNNADGVGSFPPLQPAMSFKTRISAFHTIEANQSVGYGCTFHAAKGSRIATIPVGYADGYSRLLSNQGTVLIRGYRVPVAGRVCMDQIMLDVTAIPEIELGDEVLLFGESSLGHLHVEEVSELTNTINYEVISAIAKRVPRIYFKSGRIAAMINHLI